VSSAINRALKNVERLSDSASCLASPTSTRTLPAFPHNPTRPPQGFVALGDSYSAGIGTGVDGKEEDCRRGLHAYPELMLSDLTEGAADNSTAFQFLSCTGATTDDILAGGDRSQIDDFNITSSADFAMLSVGGNDLGFFEVMNACIFRFYSFYSGTCDTALANAEKQIASTEFETRLDVLIMEILDKVQWEKQPWFIITITGYARFFNADTDECDECSFGIWWRGPKLKKEIRQRMNDMVVAVNGKIQRSIDIINSRFTRPKVFFVNYDDRFDGHRFCEPNVTEPAYNRTDTWFFLVGGNDNAPGSPNMTDPMPPPPPPLPSNGTEPGKTFRAEILPPASPIVDPETCLAPAQKSGDWGLLALCYMAMAKHRDPSLRFANEGITVQNSMWYVPTYYGKTFHPVSTATSDALGIELADMHGRDL
jgi:lysophospholipase L1-like esterase